MFYFYQIGVLTLVFTPHFAKDHGVVTAGIVYTVALFFGLASYFSFINTSLTDAGSVSPNFIHAMPSYESMKARNTISDGSNGANEHVEPQEDMYSQVLRNYEEYANMKGSRDEINQTNVTDVENPAGYVVPASNSRVRNAIVNSF